MKTEKNLSERIEKINKLELTGSVQKKKGRYYVVISYTDENGKSKPKWRATGLDAIPGNKKAAKNKIPEIISIFKDDLIREIKKEYQSNITPLKPEQLEIEYGKVESNIIDNEAIGDGLDQQRMNKYKNMSFLEYLSESIEEFSHYIEASTYDSWISIYKSRITDYFRVITLQERTNMMNPDVERPIYYENIPKFIEITQFDIEDFFEWLYDCGLKGSSADKYYTVFKLSFDRAVRKKIIKKLDNPMTDVPKPKIETYIADYYKPSELKTLFNIVKDDIIEVPILFAGTYGLRRSEVLGIKWDAIDFEAGTFVIKHTVTKVTGRGEKQVIQCKDLAKSVYGYRTYPLTPELKKALTRLKMRIEINKKYVFRNKYVQQTKDYICVKENGELIKPDHLTKRFQLLATEKDLKKIRLHDLRHSVGSLLAANNANLRQIQDFLGHGSIRSTERYSHLQYENKESSIGIIKNAIGVVNT